MNTKLLYKFPFLINFKLRKVFLICLFRVKNSVDRNFGTEYIKVVSFQTLSDRDVEPRGILKLLSIHHIWQIWFCVIKFYSRNLKLIWKDSLQWHFQKFWILFAYFRTSLVTKFTPTIGVLRLKNLISHTTY